MNPPLLKKVGYKLISYFLLRIKKLAVLIIRWVHILIIKFFLDQYIEIISRKSGTNRFFHRLLAILKTDLQKLDFNSLKSRHKYSLADHLGTANNVVASLVTKNLQVLPEVIQFCSKSKIAFKPVNLNIYKFNEAVVTYGSDIIRLNKGECYWYKAQQHFMYKTIPADSDVYSYDGKGESVLLANAKYGREKLAKVVSLVGALDFSWAHFIVEYLPKIKILKKYYYKEQLTVIIPKSLEENCREMVELLKSPYWNIYELEKDYSVVCEDLYYIDSTSWLTDHSETLILGDTMLYEIALDTLKDLVSNYQKSQIKTTQRSKRIYLRRGNTYRSLTNLGEIDSLLEKYNFEVIYGDELTLKEKAKIFYQAEIIVGPGSSGFINMIFCQKDTKIISFVNKNRVWDTYMPTLGDSFDLDFKFLLSNEEEDINDPHTSYSIDALILEKEIMRGLYLTELS